MNLRGYLNLHKLPTTIIYISLFLSSLLLFSTTETSGTAFRHSAKLKTCDWEKKCLKYMSERNLSNSSRRPDHVSL